MAGATVALCGKKMKRRDSFAFTVVIRHVLLRTCLRCSNVKTGFPTYIQINVRASYQMYSFGCVYIDTARKYSTVFCRTLFVKRWVDGGWPTSSNTNMNLWMDLIKFQLFCFALFWYVKIKITKNANISENYSNSKRY